MVSYFSGTLNSYLCNKFWTFNDTKKLYNIRKRLLQNLIIL
ncbi:hypothetical protein [Clostridium sp.]|nr:hypothetical protein [Clostridium sp.]